MQADRGPKVIMHVLRIRKGDISLRGNTRIRGWKYVKLNGVNKGEKTSGVGGRHKWRISF